MKSLMTSAGVAALLSLAGVGSALAQSTTFANIQSTTTANFYQNGTSGDLYTIATPSGTTAAATPIVFSFENLNHTYYADTNEHGLTKVIKNVGATLYLSATPVGTDYTDTTQTLDEQLYSGSFSIVLTQPALNYVYKSGAVGQSIPTGTILLAGTFTDATFEAPDGAQSGGLLASDTGGGTLNFTSGLVTFAPGTELDFSLNFSSANPDFSYNGTYLSDVSVNADGNFDYASQPYAKPPSPPGTVPEPASWAMMLVGVGMVGAMMRRRARAEVA